MCTCSPKKTNNSTKLTFKLENSGFLKITTKIDFLSCLHMNQIVLQSHWFANKSESIYEMSTVSKGVTESTEWASVSETEIVTKGETEGERSGEYGWENRGNYISQAFHLLWPRADGFREAVSHEYEYGLRIPTATIQSLGLPFATGVILSKLLSALFPWLPHL